MRSISIRVLIAGLMLLPIAAVSAALIWLSASSNQRIAEDLGGQVVRSANAAVTARMSDYLADAMHVSGLYAGLLCQAQLSPTDLAAWQQNLLAHLTAFPDVASICFGNSRGDAVWLLRHGDRLEFGLADGADGSTREFVMGDDGTLDPTPIREYRYDPRTRPWWKTAIDTDEPRWTDIYFWFGDAGADAEIGAGFTRQVAGVDGAPAGVLVIDVTLGALNQFLAAQPLARTGGIFVLDEQSVLVAASQGRATSPDGKRLRLDQSESPIARKLASAGPARAETPKQFEGSEFFRVMLDDGPARAAQALFAPSPGLKWTVVAVVPESEFLEEARRVQSRSIALGAIAVGASLVLALLTSRRIVGPLLDLRRHVQRVGGGDFDSRLNLRAARELSEMSDALNAMTGQLKRHVQAQHAMAVAVEVQQSLLPQKSPELDWVEVAGQTRYCDETGGDYYDFIEMEEPNSRSLLIALGNVQGHGVSAALLMATARAALHAHAPETPSLAELMTKVNRLLVRNAKKIRFMTLALLRLRPGQADLCWSSAGHDGPIVYNPLQDEFRELEGGDVPLGIMPGVRYQEYAAGGTAPGTVIFVGTDGIWEARSPADEMFGKERLRSVIRRGHAGGAKHIASELTRELEVFCAGQFEDDVTFVVVRFL